jgi:hypothetical protein
VLGIAMLVAGGHTYAIDNEAQYQTTRSLWAGTARLESVLPAWIDHPRGPYRPHRDGGYVAVVGLGQSVAALPLYAVGRLVAEAAPAAQREALVRMATFFANSVLLAATAAVVAVAARLFTSSARGAVLLGAAYGLGTFALPHAKTFFTEIGTSLFVLLGAWAAMRFSRDGDRRSALLAGCATGVALWFRVSAGLFLPLAGAAVVVAAASRRPAAASPSALERVRDGVCAGLWFCAGAAPPLLLLGLANWWRFGAPLDPGYLAVPQSFPLRQGLAGTLFSPGKSLFLFAPLAVLAVPGTWVALRARRFEILLPVAIVVANLVFFARVPYWHGDHAFGPRSQQIVLPCVAVLAAPLLDRSLWRRALAALAIAGVVVPVALGCLVSFNAHFAAAASALGRDAGREIRGQWRWHPFVGHARLARQGLANASSGDATAAAEIPRQRYSDDPRTHYAFFAGRPRFDFWWLWVAAMGASPLAYLFLAPAIAALVAGGVGLSRAWGRLAA